MPIFLWAPLLAQSSDDEMTPLQQFSFSPYLPALVGLAGLSVVLWFIALVVFRSIKHAERTRQMTHTERLKAIEAGLSWQEPAPAAESGQDKQESIEAAMLNSHFWISFWMMVFAAATPFWAVTSWLSNCQVASRDLVVTGLLGAVGSSITASVSVMKIMTSVRKPSQP